MWANQRCCDWWPTGILKSELIMFDCRHRQNALIGSTWFLAISRVSKCWSSFMEGEQMTAVSVGAVCGGWQWLFDCDGLVSPVDYVDCLIHTSPDANALIIMSGTSLIIKFLSNFITVITVNLYSAFFVKEPQARWEPQTLGVLSVATVHKLIIRLWKNRV